MSKLSVTREFHVRTEGRGRKRIRRGPKSATVDCVPRVAKLMALAIRFDELISYGTVTDQAELARIGQVTRARLTQIMNLLSLAPTIQEQLLFLSADAADPHGAITERHLRRVSAPVDWSTQRKLLRRMKVGRSMRRESASIQLRT
jgi:hypothetical protein